MTYRLATSLVVLRAEVNIKWPNRDKSSDGWIGDVAHASRNSDHNPWVKDARGVGVVRAFDVDAGPGANVEIGRWVAEHVRALGARGFAPLGSGAYVISAGRIASSMSRWSWKTYSGPNPHYSHTHISVGTKPAAYDSGISWDITISAAPPNPPNTNGERTLKRGMTGDDVEALQRVLNRWYRSLPPLVEDGVFGAETEERVKYLQRRAGLVVDGIAGKNTKAVLGL